MEIQIVTGTVEHLADCKEACRYSELGEVYNHSDEEFNAFLTEGFDRGEIFVALDAAGNCLGYIWITLKGSFYGFPYCRNLAVKREFRGRGVGTALLKYYDEIGFASSARLFILVSDFNHRARKLYESRGFRQVGLIPDLFKAGVAEYVLVKYRPEEEKSLGP